MKLVDDDALRFEQGLAPLRACFGQERAGAELLVETQADGRLTRCESRNAPDAASRCACEAFLAHASAGGKSRGMRVHVGVSFLPADRISAGNAVITGSSTARYESYVNAMGDKRYRAMVSDPSISDWSPPEGDAFEPCFLEEEEPGEHHAWATITFDAAGRPSDAVLQLKKGVSWKPERLACVREAFLKAKTPCPASGGVTAKAHMKVRLEAITAE